MGAPPSQAISLMERADTIEALPVSTARGSIDLTRAHTHSPIRDVAHGVSDRNHPNFALRGKALLHNYYAGAARVNSTRQPGRHKECTRYSPIGDACSRGK